MFETQRRREAITVLAVWVQNACFFIFRLVNDIDCSCTGDRKLLLDCMHAAKRSFFCLCPFKYHF